METPVDVESHSYAVTSDRYHPKPWSLHGRLGRVRYIAYNVYFILVWGALIGGLIALGETANNRFEWVFLLAFMATWISGIVIFWAYDVRRLHDLNVSGWLTLINFVPVANIIFHVVLGVWPGSRGANLYGPAPTPNTLGVKIAFALIAVWLVGIIALFTLPAVNP